MKIHPKSEKMTFFDSSKLPNSTFDSRGSIFSKLRIKSWSFSRLCMAGDWRSPHMKLSTKKPGKGGPWTTHPEKSVLIWILPLRPKTALVVKVDINVNSRPAKSLANHVLSSSICWRISGFCKTCLLSELISLVEGWKHGGCVPPLVFPTNILYQVSWF